MIERVLTQFQAIPKDDLDYLLDKLDYYSEMATREESTKIPTQPDQRPLAAGRLQSEGAQASGFGATAPKTPSWLR
jgi:hypothetical protein